MAVDPVCGMNVKESSAENISVYKGTKYYFCSSVCCEEFDRDPDMYMYADSDESETDYHDDAFDCDD